MVVSDQAKVILDDIHSVILEIQTVLSHLSDIILKTDPDSNDSISLRLEVPQSNISHQIDRDVVSKALCDGKLSQVYQSNRKEMKDKLEQQFIKLYTDYCGLMAKLTECNLTDLHSFVEPYILPAISSSLRTAVALVSEPRSNSNDEVISYCLKQSYSRLKTVSSSLKTGW